MSHLNQILSPVEEYMSNFGLIKELHPLVEFIANLSMPVAASLAFFFLPVFLASWLIVLNLFDASASMKRSMFIILSLAYILLISWLKIHSNQIFELKSINHRLLHYALEHNDNKVCIKDFEYTSIKKKKIITAVNHFYETFKLNATKDSILIIDEQAIESINQKEQDLIYYIESKSQEERVDIEALVMTLESQRYGLLDEGYLWDLAFRNQDKFKIYENDFVGPGFNPATEKPTVLSD